MQKDTKIALAFTGSTVLLLVLLAIFRYEHRPTLEEGQVVSLENGIQVIDLAAKGGYSPAVVKATAGLPTELHVATNGTYDCSSTLVIPSLNYEKVLPPTGTEVVALSPEQAQGKLEGQCGLGIYDFEIDFM